MPEFNILDNNNKEILQDIIVDRLIKETLKSDIYLWSKNSDYYSIQYKHIHKINETIDIVFNLHFYKHHQDYSLNIYLERNHGRKIINVLFIREKRLKELFETIENSKCYYNI